MEAECSWNNFAPVLWADEGTSCVGGIDVKPHVVPLADRSELENVVVGAARGRAQSGNDAEGYESCKPPGQG